MNNVHVYSMNSSLINMEFDHKLNLINWSYVIKDITRLIYNSYNIDYFNFSIHESKLENWN